MVCNSSYFSPYGTPHEGAMNLGLEIRVGRVFVFVWVSSVMLCHVVQELDLVKVVLCLPASARKGVSTGDSKLV